MEENEAENSSRSLPVGRSAPRSHRSLRPRSLMPSRCWCPPPCGLLGLSYCSLVGHAAPAACAAVCALALRLGCCSRQRCCRRRARSFCDGPGVARIACITSSRCICWCCCRWPHRASVAHASPRRRRRLRRRLRRRRRAGRHRPEPTHPALTHLLPSGSGLLPPVCIQAPSPLNHFSPLNHAPRSFACFAHAHARLTRSIAPASAAARLSAAAARTPHSEHRSCFIQLLHASRPQQRSRQVRISRDLQLITSAVLSRSRSRPRCPEQALTRSLPLPHTDGGLSPAVCIHNLFNAQSLRSIAPASAAARLSAAAALSTSPHLARFAAPNRPS